MLKFSKKFVIIIIELKKKEKIKMAGKLYDEKSIESLSPLEFTRLRPGVYAGDCTYSTQLLVEIISNAVDEFRAGHGNLIKVKIDKDIVTVEDELATVDAIIVTAFHYFDEIEKQLSRKVQCPIISIEDILYTF